MRKMILEMVFDCREDSDEVFVNLLQEDEGVREDERVKG
jgi:hypothetical protein